MTPPTPAQTADSALDFRALFERAPGRFLVLRADSPRFTIMAASDDYLAIARATREGGESIIGRGVFEVFPDQPGDADASGVRNLRASLERTIASGAPDEMPVQRYPVRAPDGSWEQRFWSPLNVPIVDPASGRVTIIIHRVEDVTEVVALSAAQHREADLARRTADAEFAARRVGEILESISDAFFALDAQWRFTYVNYQAETLLFRGRADLVGRSIWEEFPEALGTSFEQQYRRAVNERVTVRFEEYFQPLDSWFDVRAYPSADGLTVYFQNINERRLGERLAHFSADIGHAVTQGGSIASITARCCEAAVTHLRAAFCRVWVLGGDDMLTLIASAGMYTHLDGAHGRVPLGQFKIGTIAAEKSPHLTNAVIGDRQVSNQEWARREGMAAFAGYPLMIGGSVIGVVAMFARTPLSKPEFDALRTAADAISVAVESARAFAAEQAARKEAETAVSELNHANMMLQDQTVELEAQAEELAVATEELAERTNVAEDARAAAEQANRSKSEFLATMSHELRTPLNAIGGYASLMEMGVQGPVTPEQRTALERIQRSQRHLLGLIDGILNYAKLDAGAVSYAVENVQLTEMLNACEALVAPQAAARGLQLQLVPCSETLVARADREKVQQVVLNLLSNAIKFTEAGGHVTFGCLRDGESAAVIRVSDTGRGIAADQLDRVFEPFVQVDATLTRTKEGTGLGLAISRDLARGMGGELVAQSTPGAGSTFVLSLPLAS